MENTALPIPEDLVGALSVIVKTLPMEMEWRLLKTLVYLI